MPDDPNTQSYIERGLADLRNVGPEKPVGYLPVGLLTTYFRSSMDEWVRFAEQHHLNVLLTQADADGRVPFLYLYDVHALQELLQRNLHVLKAANWPADPEAFIQRVNIEDAPVGTPLYDLIADAFGDKDNPCRSDRL